MLGLYVAEMDGLNCGLSAAEPRSRRPNPIPSAHLLVCLFRRKSNEKRDFQIACSKQEQRQMNLFKKGEENSISSVLRRA